MTLQELRPSKKRFDPRALPIALKITLGLVVVLFLGSLIADRVVSNVLYRAQTNLVLDDLETLSRAQSFRIVDILGQEMVTLTQLGDSKGVQYQFLLRENRLSSGLEQLDPDQTYQPIADMEQLVYNFRETHGEFDSVAILDKDGYVLAMDPPLGETVNLPRPGRWMWFENVAQSEEAFLASRIDDQLTGSIGVHIALPIYNELDRSEVVGVIYGVWNMSNVHDIEDLGNDRESLVLKKTGTVIISPTDVAGAGFSESFMTKLNSLEDERSLAYTEEAGREWLYGFTYLADLGLADDPTAELDWIILTRQPLEATRLASAQLVNHIRVIIGASVAFITLAVLLFTRGIILTPLMKLTQAATQIEAGKLQAPIPELPTDEVGHLANVLRDLVSLLLHRVEQLDAAVQVSRETSITMDINKMLENSARLLFERFGYPDVRIYLSDKAKKQIWLQASAGERSEHWSRIGHRLSIDESSLIGRAVLFNEPQLTAPEGPWIWAGAEIKQAELAMPLQAAGQSLGVLFLAAKWPETFEQEEIDLLHLITDQIGTAITNAQLFEQSAANLKEIEALNRRLTRQAWEDHLTEGGPLRHTRDPQQRWPNPVESIAEQTEIKASVYEDAEGRSVLAAPLILRGEAVGALAVTRPGDETWARDEIILIESIAARMAIIAEGIRLVEETTERAAREQEVNEISANLLQRAASVDNVLQSALNQLSDTLGSNHISLRIGAPPIDGDRRLTPRSTDRPEQIEPPTPSHESPGLQSGLEEETGTPGVNGDGSSRNE